MMRLSPAGVTLIQGFEECRLVAYQDIRGRWTIGWGHTGPDVAKGTTWTQQFADAVFMRDVHWAEEAVNSLVRVALSQAQFDALVALVFNIGVHEFTSSTLLQKLNGSDYRGAQSQFRRWNKSTVDGKLVTVAGLTRRRDAEAKLFGSA